MKITKNEIERISKIISSKLYDNARNELSNLKNAKVGSILKKAEGDISEIEKLVIDFNIKYKTNVSVGTYSNTIAESLINLEEDKINNKYSDLRENIDTYLFSIKETSKTYNGFIELIEKKYNIILK